MSGGKAQGGGENSASLKHPAQGYTVSGEGGVWWDGDLRELTVRR